MLKFYDSLVIGFICFSVYTSMIDFVNCFYYCYRNTLDCLQPAFESVGEVLVELSYESMLHFIFCFPENEPGIELSVSILGVV